MVGLATYYAIPVEAMTLQRRERDSFRISARSWFIDIVKTQEPLAVVRSGVEIARYSSDQGAEVQWTRSGRCEPTDIHGSVLLTSELTFFLFLKIFAVDAEVRGGACLQSCLTNGVAAALTVAVIAVIDFL